jgi:hypothetical protein
MKTMTMMTDGREGDSLPLSPEKSSFSAVITDIKLPQQGQRYLKGDFLVTTSFQSSYGCHQIILFVFGAVAVKFCKQFDFCGLRSKLVESLSLRQSFARGPSLGLGFGPRPPAALTAANRLKFESFPATTAYFAYLDSVCGESNRRMFKAEACFAAKCEIAVGAKCSARRSSILKKEKSCKSAN